MLLKIHELKKTYQRGHQEVSALKEISLEVQQGQFMSIMGPSGSGKSSLLQLVGGLDRPTSGHIEFAGVSITKMTDDALSIFRRRKLGYVFQFFNLLPSLSALENVTLPLLLDGHSLRSVRPKALELLEYMGLRERAEHRPAELSGGEMQRVAIARALVTDPLLILADEPTGNLDTKSGENVLSLLRELVRERQQTILMVTHDPRAAQYGSRTLILQDGRMESDTLKVDALKLDHAKKEVSPEVSPKVSLEASRIDKC